MGVFFKGSFITSSSATSAPTIAIPIMDHGVFTRLGHKVRGAELAAATYAAAAIAQSLMTTANTAPS